jgi:hypothetical protein
MSAMPMSNTGLGLFGIDDETQARMRQALTQAAARARGDAMGGSIGGITPEEAQESEIRMLNANRRQEMMQYFTNSPVGRLERSGLEALSNVAGAQAISKGASVMGGVFGRVPSSAATRTIGAANQRMSTASNATFYGSTTPNYAMKGIGSPIGGAIGAVDDIAPVGALLDLNKVRYTIANPGIYARTAMNKEVFRMTGRTQ